MVFGVGPVLINLGWLATLCISLHLMGFELEVEKLTVNKKTLRYYQVTIVVIGVKSASMLQQRSKVTSHLDSFMCCR